MDRDSTFAPRTRRGALKFVNRRSREEVMAYAKMLEANDADHTLEGLAMSAGKQIRLGRRDVTDLQTIAVWKSPRRQGLLAGNRPELVAEALDIACVARSERIAVVTLSALSGVGIPMASAIMTCIQPDRYTVIDVRALDALGEGGRGITADVYEAYLTFCREEANRLGIPLRTLDRALWQAGSPR